MDCAGNCNGDDRLTPCGDCSDISNCNFLVDIIDSAHTDNNFRSDNIQIPISIYDFNFVGGFDELSPGSDGFEGVEFIVNFDPELLEINSDNSFSLLDGFTYFSNVISPGEFSSILYADTTAGSFQSLDGPIFNLSFDVIDAVYTPELHESITEIQVALIDLNGVDLSGEDITDTDTLTIYTKACIDPFASILNPSNFICDVDDEYGDDDVCDEYGIKEGSDIFNYGCILPESDFEDILNSVSIETDPLEIGTTNYTLIVPSGTVVTFPTEDDTSLNIISSDLVNINFLPDVAPGAQLAGSLVGLYPFGTTFDPPVNFIFTFTDQSLSRSTPEYKILYMDDIQTGDWEEIGTCLEEDDFRFCNIEELSNSGVFIVMYGENLAIDEFAIPSDYNLYRSYPNPFNPITTLEFDVANSGIVNFTVYNINGQIVESISPKFYTPGNYRINWEAQDISSGIYFIQMKTESSAHLQKVMLLK
jgi:hypothetical protein